MLDYKDIIIKHFALGLSGSEIARQLQVSKSGVNDFLKAFRESDKIGFPLPEGITNYGIAEIVYGKVPGTNSRDTSFELPDFEEISKQMNTKKNMTLIYQWNIYSRRCRDEEKKFYQYRQFCDLYAKWCKENYETIHFNAVIAQKMEVDFAGKTFELIDKFTGEVIQIVVFVAVLPFSQYIYAEGMVSTKEPQWIEVNNHALTYFGGVPLIVVCDNCKQAVIANKDWIDPMLNQDYAEWAEHNRTAILPAKVRKPKYKSSVENAVGVLEKGIFHDLEERRYFSLEQFNEDLRDLLDKVNRAPFQKKDGSRYSMWKEEQQELMPLPQMPYQFMERRVAKVSSDFHIRYDNAYYSVDKAYLHKTVSVRATATAIRIYSMEGKFICEWPRATHKGQWFTDPKHLPSKLNDVSEWNSTYFIKKAMTIGPKTVEVIKYVLKSRKDEVQTYRLCKGILNYATRYGKNTLEECCALAVDSDRISYSFIKNSIASLSEDLKPNESAAEKLNSERNRGAFVMNPKNMDVGKLLSRSETLAHSTGKEASDE